jgi:hypothetical protein
MTDVIEKIAIEFHKIDNEEIGDDLPWDLVANHFKERFRQMARLAKSMLDAEETLPCDFVVGHVRFGKGVKLETVRQAAERWFKMAGMDFNPDPVKLEEIRRLFGGHLGTDQ